METCHDIQLVCRMKFVSYDSPSGAWLEEGKWWRGCSLYWSPQRVLSCFVWLDLSWSLQSKFVPLMYGFEGFKLVRLARYFVIDFSLDSAQYFVLVSSQMQLFQAFKLSIWVTKIEFIALTILRDKIYTFFCLYLAGFKLPIDPQSEDSPINVWASSSTLQVWTFLLWQPHTEARNHHDQLNTPHGLIFSLESKLH